MTEIKLVTIDIDGTLMNDQHEIPSANVDAIKAAVAQGVKIVIATGRPLSGVKAVLEQLGINQSDQYVMTFNGGLLQQADGQVIDETLLDYANYQALQDFADSQGAFVQVDTADQALTTSHHVPSWASYENALVSLPLHVDSAYLSKDLAILKAMIIAQPEKIDSIQAALPEQLTTQMAVTRSFKAYLEFNTQGISKGTALTKLADKLNIPIAQTMAIGDQGNDASMIQAAGIGVAMGNAAPAILALADAQTTTNNEAGVAAALRTYGVV